MGTQELDTGLNDGNKIDKKIKCDLEDVLHVICDRQGNIRQYKMSAKLS